MGAGRMAFDRIRVGCAGWSIPKEHAGRFPEDGSHLARYAERFPAVEINSSFYRPHRPSTYARWAAETPEGFAFAVKVPKEITHTRRLVDADEPLDRFLDETAALGDKRGPAPGPAAAEPGLRRRTSRRSFFAAPAATGTTAPSRASPGTRGGSRPRPSGS